MHYSLITIALVTVISACGNKQSSERSSGGEDAKQPNTSSSNSEISTGLEGHWRFSRCDDPDDLYQVTIEFSGNSLTIEIRDYEDRNPSGCSGPLVASDTFKGSFELLDAAQSVGGGHSRINYTLTERQMTPHTAAVASKWNKEAACEITDWTAGETKTFPYKECSGAYYMPATLYNIYSIENGKSLVFGELTNGDSGDSDEKRPTTLNTTAVYEKL